MINPLGSGDKNLPSWYALHVRSRHEKTVHAQLEAKQHDSFLPLYAAKHRWVDRWQTVELPLFPGYVFCRFEMVQRSSVLATSGVIDLVRIGSEPAPIDASEMEAIQRAAQSCLKLEPHRGLAAGNRVILTDGPLKGLSGTLMEIRKDIRLVISVELLCRSILVEINRDWVMPCHKTPYGLSQYAALQMSKN